MGKAPLSRALCEIKQLLCVILYYIKQIDSMLPYICPVIDHRGRQSRSQSFVPLDQRSENESSGSIRFEITEFCPSGFTAQSQVFFKMADQATLDLFHGALNYGLQSLGFDNISLKEKQYEVIRELVVENSDVLAVLPTGYGKSLIYQLLPPVLNFMEGSSAKKFSVMVISPLNALIRDQIVKIREAGLNVCMLKGDRVTGDDDGEDVSLTVPLETLLSTCYDLINK